MPMPTLPSESDALRGERRAAIWTADEDRDLLSSCGLTIWLMLATAPIDDRVSSDNHPNPQRPTIYLPGKICHPPCKFSAGDAWHRSLNSVNPRVRGRGVQRGARPPASVNKQADSYAPRLGDQRSPSPPVVKRHGCADRRFTIGVFLLLESVVCLLKRVTPCKPHHEPTKARAEFGVAIDRNSHGTILIDLPGRVGATALV